MNKANVMNYRVTFGGEDIDSKKDFEKCRDYFNIIDQIMAMAEARGITEIWWFFEPYVEITWIDEDDSFLEEIKSFLSDKDIEYKTQVPEDGFFADWFGSDVEERKLGYQRYASLRKTSQLLLRNKDIIENGEGWHGHFLRCCHTLANQLALNYKEEGIAMLGRSLQCLMWHYQNKKTVRGLFFYTLTKAKILNPHTTKIAICSGLVIILSLLLINWKYAIVFIAGNLLMNLIIHGVSRYVK